ncbi:hypothetical protein D770_00955 [Flammeovirgaceae bacterium 311]|nr:hypothetical protein D770_00955 [Flammeovirgaceae bacterium 311]
MFRNFQYIKEFYLSGISACLVFTLVSLLSCIPEPLEVKHTPTVKPEIVVATQMLHDEMLVVLLTKTFGALDASGDSDPLKLIEQIAVSDAVVSISGPEGSYQLEALGYGAYGGTLIPFKEGSMYELHVNSASLGEVYASARVLGKVEFNEISADLYYDENGDTLAHLTYSLSDPVENNWYMLGVQEINREHIIHNLINPRAYTELFDDINTLEQEEFLNQYKVIPRVYDPGDTIIVSLSNISKEYYEFMQMRLDNRFSFIEFLGEPINYPSNVVGGKGFFNLNIPHYRVFVFDQ